MKEAMECPLEQCRGNQYRVVSNKSIKKGSFYFHFTFHLLTQIHSLDSSLFLPCFFFVPESQFSCSLYLKKVHTPRRQASHLLES